MMRAVRAGVGLCKVSIPSAQAGETLVKVKACGVNFPEVLQNEGKYPARPGVTDVLGLEVAGTVVDAQGNETGEHVCALVNGGSYADFCLVKDRHCLPIPFKGQDAFEKAGALPETVFTVWNNLFWDGPDTLKGKSVFVHGGSSGIGTTAITLAKSFGASLVQTTAGTEKKCRFAVEECGADVAFNYKEQKWWEQAEKADVVLDMVGGDYFNKNLALLRDNGRLVIIGFLQSPITEKANMTRILLKSLHVTGSVLRSASDDHKANLCEGIRKYVWPRIEDGSVRLPHISHRFKLDQYDQAHATMRDSSHIGKIILTP